MINHTKTLFSLIVGHSRGSIYLEYLPTKNNIRFNIIIKPPKLIVKKDNLTPKNINNKILYKSVKIPKQIENTKKYNIKKNRLSMFVSIG